MWGVRSSAQPSNSISWAEVQAVEAAFEQSPVYAIFPWFLSAHAYERYSVCAPRPAM